jgi:hypothetical protein
MALKLPRTIRLDPSDRFVFARAAEPGEWAVSGAFAFHGALPEQLSPKARTAFRSGFLGVESLGWSTLVVVQEASAAERVAAVEALARGLVARFGAPGLEVARAAAEEEVAFAASLCDHPAQTLVAVQRVFEQGEIRERFRTLTPRADRQDTSFRAFEFFQSDADEAPAEQVDLLALGPKAQP